MPCRAHSDDGRVSPPGRGLCWPRDGASGGMRIARPGLRKIGRISPAASHEQERQSTTMSNDRTDAAPAGRLPARATRQRTPSSRRRLLDALRAAQGMIEALPNAVFFTDTDGYYRGVNKAWEWLFGLDRALVVGKRADEIFAGKSDLIALSSVPLESAGSKFELEIRDAEGARHDVICYRAAYATPAGEIAGLIGTIVDITDRRRAEKRQAMEHAVTRVLAEASNVEDAILRTIETICRTLEWHYGARWEWRAEDGLPAPARDLAHRYS
jgi:PAS domain S-box-containing protein